MIPPVSVKSAFSKCRVQDPFLAPGVSSPQTMNVFFYPEDRLSSRAYSGPNPARVSSEPNTLSEMSRTVYVSHEHRARIVPGMSLNKHHYCVNLYSWSPQRLTKEFDLKCFAWSLRRLRSSAAGVFCHRTDILSAGFGTVPPPKNDWLHSIQ